MQSFFKRIFDYCLFSSCEIVEKPWGREFKIFHNEKYVLKLLFVEKGHRLSYQYHEKKHESFIMLSDAVIRLEEGEKDFYKGEFLDLPPFTKHQIIAKNANVYILEVSTPELTDIVRIEDPYNRI